MLAEPGLNLANGNFSAKYEPGNQMNEHILMTITSQNSASGAENCAELVCRELGYFCPPSSEQARKLLDSIEGCYFLIGLRDRRSSGLWSIASPKLAPQSL